MTTSQMSLIVIVIVIILVIAFVVYEIKHAQEVDPDDETF